MIRLLTVAAVAALVAAPASAQSVRINTAGKTPAQVKAEVFKAATRLCALDTNGASFAIEANRACVKNTVTAALAQSSDPALQLAQR
jgi:hypothetical protein